MSSPAELQEKIALLAGQINQKKQQGSNNNYYASSSPYRGPPRWSPYGRGGGYAGHVRNLSLVNSTPDVRTATATKDTTNTSNAQAKNFTSHKTHQLMTKDVYEREQKHRELRAAKRQRIDQKERTALKEYASQEAVIEGIRFQLRDDLSKLMRIDGEHIKYTTGVRMLSSEPDPTSIGKQSPKIAKYGGFTFLRTKHGNLIRANAIKDLTRYRLKPRNNPTTDQNLLVKYFRTNAGKQKSQCEYFTKNGTCPFGRFCHYAHDPNKVAICPAFLKGRCPAGDYCDLSHVISSNRVPSCYHFLRGNCTNDACRYPHVFVPASAPICRPFARLGYCANDDCPKRHVFECPDNETVAGCTNPQCALPHPDRAHVLRKLAATEAKISSEGASDVSSDDDNETGFDDIDSDEAEDVIMSGIHDDSHELSQQADFVAFT